MYLLSTISREPQNGETNNKTEGKEVEVDKRGGTERGG